MRTLTFIILIATTLIGCGQGKKSLLLSKDFVDLRGAEGLTVLRNLTKDTVIFSGTFYTYLPYAESKFLVSIPSGEQDTLIFNFQYPDFIFFESHDLRIFNGPNKTLICKIASLSPESIKINFEGDFATVNQYHLGYHNHFGSYAQENKPYYTIGESLKNFDNFPSLADSVNQLNIDFLNNFQGDLPDWFKKHEAWRLHYNSAFRKYNVLFAKEFYSGKKIAVKDQYFDFEKDLRLDNTEMIINTEYLSYAMFFTHRLSKRSIRAEKNDPMLCLVDSLLPLAEIGDVLKLKRMFDIYEHSKKEYEANIATAFTNSNYRKLLDSLVMSKFGLPRVGERLPSLTLEDINGNDALLTNYSGHSIILNFWASWCGPCLKEFPYENKLYQDYKNKGLLIINICIQTDKSTWKQISKEKDLKMINLYLNSEHEEEIVKEFEIGSLPRSILINPKMIVTDNHFVRPSLLTTSEIEKILASASR